jgi:hypothetical protein
MEKDLGQERRPEQTERASMESAKAGDRRESPADVRDKARELAHEAGQVGKSVAVEEIDALAGGLRKSAEGWDDQRHGWVKEYLGGAAEGLDRFSTTLRERDLRSFIAEAEAIARHHPALFIAGCGAAGFAVTRFLKSGKREGV